MSDAWLNTWRNGAAPCLSTKGLEALRRALVEDDPRLLQGATTSPPPLTSVQDWPVEGACAISYCGWQGDGLETVAEVEEFFSRMCAAIGVTLGELSACRWFLNWFDNTDRIEMRALLLPEVERELQRRQVEEVCA